MKNLDEPIKVAEMRRQYTRSDLREEDLDEDPIVQFAHWLREACESGLLEPNAMSLATAWADGRPLVRTVLLKDFDARGFVFYTNLESRKARQLRENPSASLLFPWLPIERQVIIAGTVERLSAGEVLKYFITRPRESQIAAWASQQSSTLSSRKFLEMQWECLKQKFSTGQIPLPDFWGGFRVVPQEIEFWQGGPNRLHYRFLYTRQEEGAWRIDALAP